MATLKQKIEAPKIVRQTLSKQLKEAFPELFKKPKGGPRISTAALAMLSPTLRESVLREMKKAKGEVELPYTSEEVGEMVLAHFSNR